VLACNLHTHTHTHTTSRLVAPFGVASRVHLPASSSLIQADLLGANERRTLVLTTFIIYGFLLSLEEKIVGLRISNLKFKFHIPIKQSILYELLIKWDIVIENDRMETK